MKAWAIMVIVGLLTVLTVLGALILTIPTSLSLITFELGRRDPSDAAQPAPVQRPAPVADEGETVMPAFTDAEFETAWRQAPDEVREIARAIAEHEPLDPEALAKIGPEALSAGYRVPEWDISMDGQPVPFQMTLLVQALMDNDLSATKKLLAAGADPNVDYGGVLFRALYTRTPGTPNFRPFEDYDQGNAFVKLYLEAGADPNVRHYGFREETPVDYAFMDDNLGGTLLLLEHGGNPWLRFLYRDSTIMSENAMDTLARGMLNGVYAETLFRLARSGYLKRGPEPEMQNFLSELEKTVEATEGGSGPTSRHEAWRMDQVLFVLGEALDIRDKTDALRARLPAFDYQADGGWYLAEDEIHSPPDAPLGVPEAGTEIWGP